MIWSAQGERAGAVFDQPAAGDARVDLQIVGQTAAPDVESANAGEKQRTESARAIDEGRGVGGIRRDGAGDLQRAVRGEIDPAAVEGEVGGDVGEVVQCEQAVRMQNEIGIGWTLKTVQPADFVQRRDTAPHHQRAGEGADIRGLVQLQPLAPHLGRAGEGVLLDAPERDDVSDQEQAARPGDGVGEGQVLAVNQQPFIEPDGSSPRRSSKGAQS